ncbi:MAG TPA: hypothetical protein VMF06_24395 [Candidatus Limnocylindria bacterium]|jgi:hypothetical protein|nr:hypothetical protein [Candidatus Limnocylindria bacterium]
MKPYVTAAFERLEVPDAQTQSDAALELCMMLEASLWPKRLEAIHRSILPAEALSSPLNVDEIYEFVMVISEKVSNEDLVLGARMALLTALGKTGFPVALISILKFINAHCDDLDNNYLCGTLAAIKIYSTEEPEHSQIRDALQKYNTKAVLERIVEIGSDDAKSAAVRILTTITRCGF